MLGLDNIGKTRCMLIYPINKMYAIRYQMIKLKYTVRNSKKTKLNKQKTKDNVYTYDFRHSVVTDN